MATLENLPAELRLSILSHLSSKEVQKCRAINRSFRDLIELEENQSLCYGPGIARTQAQIKQAINKFCYYPVDSVDSRGRYTALLDAFRDFACTFGHESGAHSIRVFARQFRRRIRHNRSVPSYITKAIGTTSAQSYELAWLLDQVSTLHWCFHGGDESMRESANRLLANALEEPHEYIAKVIYWWTVRFGFPKNDAKNMLRRVKDGVLLGAPSASAAAENSKGYILHYKEQAANPGMLVSQATSSLTRKHWRELHESNGRTSQILGLTSIPGSMRMMYYVHSRWASETMSEAAKGQPLPPKIKAAVLEEIGLTLPQSHW